MRRKIRLTSFGRFSLWASGVAMGCMVVYGVAHRFFGIDKDVLLQLFALHAPKNSSSFQIDTASIADSIAASVERAQEIAKKSDNVRIDDDASVSFEEFSSSAEETFAHIEQLEIQLKEIGKTKGVSAEVVTESVKQIIGELKTQLENAQQTHTAILEYNDPADTDTPDSLRAIIAQMTAEQNALKKKLAELEKGNKAQGATEKQTATKQSKTTRWICRGKDFEHSFLNGVQQTPKATIVEVRFTQGLVAPKTYGQNQFLRYGKNKQLPIVSAYEVPDHPLANTDDIGKHVRIFRLEFPPLPSGVTSFDVIDINHNVNFYDIRTY